MNTAIEKVKLSEIENKIITNNQLKDNLEDVAIINIDNNYYLYNTKTKENYFPIDGEGLTSMELLNLRLDSIKSKISSDLSKLKEEIKEPKEPKTLNEAVEIFKTSNELDLSVFNKFFASKLSPADLNVLKLNLDKEKFEACLKLQLTRKNIDFKFEESNKGNPLGVFKKGLIQAYGDVVGNNYYNILLEFSNKDEEKLEAQWFEFILQKNGLSAELDKFGKCCGQEGAVDPRNLFEKKGLVGLLDATLSGTAMNKGQAELWTGVITAVALIWGGIKYFKKMGILKGLGLLVGAEFGSNLVFGKSLFTIFGSIIYGSFDFDKMSGSAGSVLGGVENKIKSLLNVFVNNNKDNFDKAKQLIQEGEVTIPQAMADFSMKSFMGNMKIQDLGKYVNEEKSTIDMEKYGNSLTGDQKEIFENLILDDKQKADGTGKMIYSTIKNQGLLNIKPNITINEYFSKLEQFTSYLKDKKHSVIPQKSQEFYDNFNENIKESDDKIFQILLDKKIIDNNTKLGTTLPLVASAQSSVENPQQEANTQNKETIDSMKLQDTLGSKMITLGYIQDGRRYMVGSDGNPQLIEFKNLPENVREELGKSNILLQKVSYLSLMLQAENPQNTDLLKEVDQLDLLGDHNQINKLIDKLIDYLGKKYDKSIPVEVGESIPDDFSLKSIFDSSKIQELQVYKYIRENIGNYSMVESLLVEDKMNKLVGTLTQEQLYDFYNLIENNSVIELHKSDNYVIKLIKANLNTYESGQLFKKLKNKLQEANEHINKKNEEINDHIKSSAGRNLTNQELIKAKQIAKSRIKNQFVAYNLKKELVLSKLDNDDAASMLKGIMGVGIRDLSDKTTDVLGDVFQFILIEAVAFAAGFVTMGIGTTLVHGIAATRYFNKARSLYQASKRMKAGVWIGETAIEGAAFYQGANMFHNIVEKRALTHGWNDLGEIGKTILFIGAMKGFNLLSSRIPGLVLKEGDKLPVSLFKKTGQVVVEGIGLGLVGGMINVVFEDGDSAWTVEQFIDGILLAIMMRLAMPGINKGKDFVIRKINNRTEVSTASETIRTSGLDISGREIISKEYYQNNFKNLKVGEQVEVAENVKITKTAENQGIVNVGEVKFEFKNGKEFDEILKRESDLLGNEIIYDSLKSNSLEMLKRSILETGKIIDPIKIENVEYRFEKTTNGIEVRKMQRDGGYEVVDLNTFVEANKLVLFESHINSFKKTLENSGLKYERMELISQEYYHTDFKDMKIGEQMEIVGNVKITKTAENQGIVNVGEVKFEFKNGKEFDGILKRESDLIGNDSIHETLKNRSFEKFERSILEAGKKIDSVIIENVEYRFEKTTNGIEVRKMQIDGGYEVVDLNNFVNTNKVVLFESYINGFKKTIESSGLKDKTIGEVIGKEGEAALEKSGTGKDKIEIIKKYTFGQFMDSVASAKGKVGEAKGYKKFTTTLSESLKILLTGTNQPGLKHLGSSTLFGLITLKEYNDSNNPNKGSRAIGSYLFYMAASRPVGLIVGLADFFNISEYLDEKTKA
ncbi:MAG: hypothetical protein V3575_00605 [Candidatus Absconditabacteria bacterium]